MKKLAIFTIAIAFFVIVIAYAKQETQSRRAQTSPASAIMGQR